MIELSGLSVRDENNPDGDIEIRFTGLRPAEKLFEELVIGKNLSGTEHPRILRAVEHAPPWSQIEGMLNELLLALERLDGPTALAILKRAVVEYQPANDPFDLTDVAEHGYPRLEHIGESNVSHLPLQRTN
jgi:FlaA1/EpsC-like NDP-sugar epimerase